jgi:dihydrofolate synthase/folylpolyglutamate synthase
MSASAASRYLAARARFGIKLGLESMRTLVAELGHPERAYPSLLVAGTNGKGSVVAYLDSALRASGLRVGRYTSPHLLRVNERIAVDGREITGRDFERLIGRVRRAAESLVARRRLPAHPTYFEVTTAAAFEHFRRQRVDVAVLEVGLGGRLDATNVAEPLASAIVSIDWDHQAQLGTTLASIAREKAGVLRPGRAAVIGPMPAEARRAIESEALRLGATLHVSSLGARLDQRGELLDVRTPQRAYEGLRALAGRHQHDNLLVAVRLLEAAAQAGLPVDWSALPRATAATRWPGRLQRIEGRPALLLDGAHNTAGARALAEYLRPLGPFVLVFGAMRDKDVRELAEPLFPLARAVVLTRPRLARAATPAQLARQVVGLAWRVHREPAPARALARARRLAGPAGLVVVAGSLYLVGAVLGLVESARKRRSVSGRSHARAPR